MDTLTTTPRAAASIIRDCIAADVPVMLHGSPGIGKSAIVRQVAAALSRDLFDVRLGILELPDLAGYICVSECRPGEPAVMTAPAALPSSSHGQPSVAFFDEITSASRELQAAAYGLVLDRRLNNYSLPLDCAVIAAGNLVGDRGVVNAMPTPLRNRFVHVQLEADRAEWLLWAQSAGIAPAVIAWHHFKTETLMVFDAKSSDHAFASPRSWEALSRILAHNANPSAQLIAGTIGTGIGLEFAGFLRVMAELSPPDLIWLNPTAAPVPTEPSACYAMAASLGAAVTVPTMAQFVAYIDRMPSEEFSVLAMDIATRRAPELAHTGPFRDWALSHKYILGIN